jgi:hypothetical protein
MLDFAAGSKILPLHGAVGSQILLHDAAGSRVNDYFINLPAA